MYVGGEDEVTLRIPVPDGTISAGGVDEDDPNFSFGGGTLNVSTPLRPGVNSIVTSYTVGYDAIEDMYRLRVTSPLPTDQLEVRVPETFVDKFEPQDDQSERASDSQFEGETILAIERIGPATPGQGLIVNLIGLSGAAPAHVLTTTTGAIVGSLLALAIIVGLAAAIARRDAEALA